MCLLCYLAALSVHAAHPERKAAMSYYSTILPFRVPIEMVGDYIRLYGAKLIYQRVPNGHSAISINPSNAKATFVQSTRTQRSKPCHVGIHWIVLPEYSEMSTMFQVFSHFLDHFVLVKLL